MRLRHYKDTWGSKAFEVHAGVLKTTESQLLFFG